MTPEAAAALAIRNSPFAWFETFGRVKGKDSKIQKPVANRMQSDLGTIYRYCRDNGFPCRIVGLKARQTGLSTGSMALMYHHARNQPTNCCIIGDEYEKSVKNLVNMFGRYAENDEFDWGSDFNPKNGKFTNGSELFTDTANDPRAGASNTFQFLDGTEVAHWPDTGIRSASSTLAAILNCVPELPNTVVILESTPNGASGAFYDTYQGAVTFEEFKAGHRGNGYIKIFYSWLDHDEYNIALDDDEIAHIRRTMTQTELKLVDTHGLKPGQIEFRRRALASPKFNGDEKLFDQEYPPDDVTCWMTSGRKKFNQDSLAKMLLKAKANKPDYGILEGKFDGIIFRRTSKEESWSWIWEMPKDGCRYSLAADPMTGMSQTGGKDPDCHSVLVLREGYFDRTGKYIIPKVAARVFYTCRVDLDVLADFIRYMTGYYGHCQFVPEANNSGIALIELLKNEADMNIYRRKQWNFRESKETEMLGWQTKDGANREGTRSICIANLAVLIREEGIDLSCEYLIAECQAFIIDDTGKAVAPPGKHDDDVLCVIPGTMVRCETGMIPIEDVKIGEKVLTHMGRFRKVTRTIQTQADFVFEVAAIGRMPLRLTANHPLLLARQSRSHANYAKTGGWLGHDAPGWLSIDSGEDLSKFSSLTSFPKDVVDVATVDLLQFAPETYKDIDGILTAFTYGGTRKNCKQNPIKRILQVDDNLCFLMGYYAAEGGLGKHNIAWASHTRERPIREKVGNYLISLGLKPYIRNQTPESWQVSVGSVVFRNFFAQFGNKQNKRLPSWVAFLPHDKQRQVLIGYLLGDGCFLGGGFSASTISHTLGTQIHEMLLRCGIPAGLTRRKGQNGHRPIYVVHGGAFSAEKIWSWVPTNLQAAKSYRRGNMKTDQTNLRFHNGYLAGGIRPVSAIEYAGTTHCLEVEEDHSFHANGTIVHNCAAIAVTTMEGATTYRVPERIRTLPADLRQIINQRNQRARSRYC